MGQINNIYSIFDVKAKTHGAPFTVLNDDVALRVVDHVLQAPDTDYRRYPDDFVVYHLGTFDTDSGLVVAVTSPRLVCSVRSRLDYLVSLASQSRIDPPAPKEEVIEGDDHD